MGIRLTANRQEDGELFSFPPRKPGNFDIRRTFGPIEPSGLYLFPGFEDRAVRKTVFHKITNKNFLYWPFLVLTVPVLMFIAGCKQEHPAGAPAGARETAQASIPSRIISAAPSNTEIIAGLGLAGRLIAIDPYSNDIAGVRPGLLEVDFFYPDAEAIIGLAPDIIIANEINNFGAADSPFKPLVDVGIRVVQIPTSTSLQGIYNDIVTIAEVLGVKQKGEVLAGDLEAEVNKIAETGKTVRDRKKVYFEISPAPYMVTLGAGTYLNEMIETIGAVNIFSDQAGWFTPSAEAILERNPDVIFCMTYHGGEDPAKAVLNRKGFETVNAVREGRVYPVDGNAAGRPSQNIISALKQMAYTAYPDLYAAD
jgi:iron complex transport system substrate-binding protein